MKEKLEITPSMIFNINSTKEHVDFRKNLINWSTDGETFNWEYYRDLSTGNLIIKRW